MIGNGLYYFTIERYSMLSTVCLHIHCHIHIQLFLHSPSALKHFQTVSKRVTQQLKEARKSIENKRQLAIGMHNAIEIKLENRYLAKATNQMRLEQKRRQLSQLREEHDSLLQVVEAQEVEMQRNG